MESRKITILSTSSQEKNVIESGAETLGQLKADLNAKGISYTNMDFLEGLTKTKLVADESLLPRDVMYRGEPTNELVFMLSTTNKKIKSGSMSRVEINAAVKELTAKDPANKAIFNEGESWTRKSSAVLEGIINSLNSNKKAVAPKTKSKCTITSEAPVASKECVKKCEGCTDQNDLCKNVLQLVEELKTAILDMEAQRCDCQKAEEELPYSNTELDNMFDFAKE